MKILFIIPYFIPAWGFGGPVNLAFNYAKELTNRGHQVTIYTSDVLDEKSRVKKKHDFIEGLEVFYFPNLSNFLAWKKIFLPVGFPKFLGKTINNFDLIHCFDFRTFQNIWVHHFAKKYKKPYVVSVLGQTGWGTGKRASVKKIYDTIFGKKILKDAVLTFAQNDHEAGDLKSFGLKMNKVALLPLAIAFSEFKNLPERGKFRQKYGIKKDDFLILFVGRIHYLKGIDFLIRALPEIKTKIKHAKLAVIGRDDGYLETLKKLAREKQVEDSVIFTGPIYEKERISAYRDADVFAITPRLFEETSLASLEAAACQAPLIVNQRCQVPYLDQYQAGLTIFDEQLKTINEEILKIFTKKEKMGKMARRMVAERFNVNKIIDQLEKYYFQILNK